MATDQCIKTEPVKMFLRTVFFRGNCNETLNESLELITLTMLANWSWDCYFFIVNIFYTLHRGFSTWKPRTVNFFFIFFLRIYWLSMNTNNDYINESSLSDSSFNVFCIRYVCDKNISILSKQQLTVKNH